jgi:flavin reductase (DIM6/NTAB) family NADH-FMN oxidoreductase RutF
MMNELFQQIEAEDIEANIFRLIGKEWMLITAGLKNNYNMMTASWGTAGVLWKKPVIFTFIRPQRHTYKFIENHPHFSVTFFSETHKDILNLCGTTSGRDLNKMNIDGLSAIETPSGSVAFKEARLVLECRKIYYDDINPELFQVFDIEKVYPAKDYHRFYIGEILRVWQKKQ